MFNLKQFRTYIVRPALDGVGLYSEAAEDLLVGTACAESMMGTYVHQVGGPALGIYQMEPNTHADIWRNYLEYREGLHDRVVGCVPANGWSSWGDMPSHALLITDLKYATVMARIHYLRSPEPLPAAGEWSGMARMWKKVYNTEAGAGTEGHFMLAVQDCGVVN
ncbi:MAG: hypothetical protein DRQ89_12470 [Epsilonproteobacteria bacterium]|nr:MAG: hypothetical protein DRQ89_12470 [Campylobacterota bacterium]